MCKLLVIIDLEEQNIGRCIVVYNIDKNLNSWIVIIR